MILGVFFLLGLNEGKGGSFSFLFFSFIIDAVCTCRSFLLIFVPWLLQFSEL